VTKRPPDPLDELFAAIKAILGRPASPETRRLFKQYLELFLRWNRVHRMTALDSPPAIVRDLFIDSLLFMKVMPLHRPVSIVDIGAGAGIPGLPLRLVDPTLTLTLVESKRKRVSFLLAVCREMSLGDVSVVEGRAEEVPAKQSPLSEAFDVAVSRAVGPIDHLLPVALPYLRPGGVLLVSGPPGGSQGHGVELEKIQVPGSKRFRSILRARK